MCSSFHVFINEPGCYVARQVDIVCILSIGLPPVSEVRFQIGIALSVRGRTYFVAEEYGANSNLIFC